VETGQAAPEPELSEEKDRALRDAAPEIDPRTPFGPAFFAKSLAALVRHTCPDPRDALPAVELHLAGGEVLHVCHIIEIEPTWIALAVRDRGSGEMRTELVPYSSIVRVTVWGSSSEGPRVGFVQDRAPAVFLTPEQALQAAARGGDLRADGEAARAD
jgi:hypothetical protein